LQVGMADNRGRGPAWTVETAGARCREALNELDLADRAHFDGTVGAVHRACLDEHRRANIVPLADIGDQLKQQIALVWDPRGAEIPEMVMWIAYRHLRLECGLVGEGQPVVASVWHVFLLWGG